jgi:hypothetical protein
MDPEKRTVSANDNTLSLDVTARVRIGELIDEFFGRVDRGESVADLLEEQASFKAPNRHAEGRGPVAELLLSLAVDRQQRGRRARHFGGNLNIQSIEAGRYRVRCLVVVLSLDSQPGPAGVLNMGDHDDVVVCGADGRYRFASRTMQPVMQLGLTAS